MLFKKAILSLIATVGLCTSATAQLRGEVSECFELTSIVFRLSEAPEYIGNYLPQYSKDIDQHFTPHKMHPIVEYARQLRETQDIGYDAVAAVAAFIEIKNGKVSEISSDRVPESRWTKESFTKFVNLLDDFYTKSDFATFYARHKQLHDIAQARFQVTLSTVDINWFDHFFDTGILKYRAVASLCNNGNYGFNEPDGTAAIAVTTFQDQDGNPTYIRVVQTIIHEMIHQYVRQIVDQNWVQIENAANTIFPYVKEKMTASAYPEPKIMANEWLVRLFTIMYFKEHPDAMYNCDVLIRMEHDYGFTWMSDSAKLMDEFYTHRNTYKTVDRFVAQLAISLNYTAAKMAIDSLREATAKNLSVALNK